MGIKSNNLLWFRERPLVGASSSMIDRAKLRSSGESQRVPSSRYQEFASRPETSLLTFSMMGGGSGQILKWTKDKVK